MVKGPFILYNSAKYLQGLFYFFDSNKHKNSLEKSGLNVLPSFYLSMALINSIIFSLIVALIVTFAGGLMLGLPTLYFPYIFLIFLFLIYIFYLLYPKLLIKKRALYLEKDLFFALKDLSIQISSGITLYESMRNVAKGNYGEVSLCFKTVLNKVDSGTSMEDAFSDLINVTDSEHFKKTIWQILGVLKSGANLEYTLKSIVDSLKRKQQTAITSYLHEINLWILIYLIIAVTIPSIVAALLSVLLTLSSGTANLSMFLLVMISAILTQILLVQYVRVKRPIVSM